MRTFKEFELDIMRVREAINDISVKGEHNASLIVYAVGRCNDMINSIHEIVNQNAQNQNALNPTSSEEVTKNAE